MVRKCGALLVILGVFLPGVASALGLGELRLTSFLNEPLRAEVDLLDIGGLDEGQLRVRLASRADFDRAGIERVYFLTGLKFEVVVREDGTGRLLITSHDPVLEPYLDFLVEARWPQGRILREYTVLLDLPALVGPDSGMTAGAIAPQPEPLVDELQTPEAQAQQARYGAEAVEPPQAGSEYLVKQDETLWSIASRARPDGSTVHQTMLDIRRLNPDAFIGGNINQMKAGYVLRLPTTAQISDTDLERAVEEIVQQGQDWRANQAAIDAREMAGDMEEGSGEGADSEEQGRLQIAGVDGDANTSAPVEGVSSADLEQLDQARRDNDELQTRILAMEEQMLTLQRLLTLKDDQIAALQSALGGEELETPAAIDEMEGTISEMPELPSEAVDETAPIEPEVQPEPRPEVDFSTPPPADEGIVGLLMDNLLYIIGVLVLLIALVVWRFKDKLKLGGLGNKLPKLGRKGTQQTTDGDTDDEFAGVELGDDGLIIDEFSDQTEEDGLSSERLSFTDTDENAYAAQFETGDALAEADIYIAYGRFPQAIDLLKAAIAVEPANVEYRVKLMEAAVEMADREEFQQQYADLQLIGDEPALRRGRELLEAVDGGEVWLEDLPEPSITEDDIAAAAAAAAPAATPEPVVEEVDLGEEDFGFDDEQVSPEDTATGLDDGLEHDSLDLDIDDLSPADDLEAAEDLELDADLSLDLDDDLAADADTDAESDTSAELDIDLEIDDAAAEPAPASDPQQLAELDEFDLDSTESADFDQLLDEAADEQSDDELVTEAAAEDEDALDLSGMVEEEPASEEQEDIEEDASDLDSFDMSDFSASQPEAEAQAEAEAEAALDDDVELPDLELDEITQDLPADEEIELVGSDSEPESADVELADELDLDSSSADEPAIEAEPMPESEEAPAPENDGLPEEPVDLSEPPAELAGNNDELITDFGDLEIESGDGFIMEAEIDLEAEAEDDVDLEQSLDELTSSFDSEPEADQEDAGLVFAADGDEISTKLDLARAYMDMGDEEGARNILEEVLQDGSDGQKQEAQSLIDSID